MVEISSTSRITIHASAHEVYKYLSNLKYYYLWNTSLRYLSYEGPLKVGVSFDSESIIFKKYSIKCHNVVTELEVDKKVGTENQLGMIKYQQVYKLQKKNQSTIVNFKIDIITPSQPFGLTNSVLKVIADRELKSHLDALKIAVENKLQ